LNVTQAEIERVEKEKDHAVLEARVPGTGKDGGPSCATVKPFEGWKLVQGRGRAPRR
jgi:hypothetical protein